MMKVYRVWADRYDYDMYDSFIVVALNEYRALEMVKDKFDKWQGAIYAEEIDLNTEHVVLGSFNAG